MNNLYSKNSVPSEWVGVMEKEVRELEFRHLSKFQYDEPIVMEIPSSACDFLHIDREKVVHSLLNEFGETKVPLVNSDGLTEETTLTDWYNNKRGRYLKDWHINRNGRCFRTPAFFSDWLNDYHIFSKGTIPNLDFQFLYWGDAGTVTGYHEDVIGTFSWSFNLNGRKRWKFFGYENGARIIRTLVQKKNKLVFVPSGLFHTVENLDEDTISINQNWFNEWNVGDVCQRLLADVLKIKSDLSEFGVKFETVKDESDRIQFLLRSNNCLDIPLLLDICEYAIDHRSEFRTTICQAILKVIEMIACADFPRTRKIQQKLDDLKQRCSPNIYFLW